MNYKKITYHRGMIVLRNRFLAMSTSKLTGFAPRSGPEEKRSPSEQTPLSEFVGCHLRALSADTMRCFFWRLKKAEKKRLNDKNLFLIRKMAVEKRNTRYSACPLPTRVTRPMSRFPILILKPTQVGSPIFNRHLVNQNQPLVCEVGLHEDRVTRPEESSVFGIKRKFCRKTSQAIRDKNFFVSLILADGPS